MQHSRYELKYLIHERVAAQVRDLVRCHLPLDEHCGGPPLCSYPVHSLYLDSDPLDLYWRTVNGDKNRYKLRVRYFSDHPRSPIFFEIKRRMKDVILKKRANVRREAAQWMIAGQLPAMEDLLPPLDESLEAAQEFVRLASSINARPKLHIYYDREAYVSADDSYRITMDRNVLSEVNPEGKIKTEMRNPVRSYPGFVILELKFTNRYPNWYADLVRMVEAVQTGSAKYVSGASLSESAGIGPVAPIY